MKQACVLDLYLVYVQALMALSNQHSLPLHFLLEPLQRISVRDVLLLQVLQVDLTERILHLFLPMHHTLLPPGFRPQKCISPTHPLCQGSLQDSVNGQGDLGTGQVNYMDEERRHDKHTI